MDVPSTNPDFVALDCFPFGCSASVVATGANAGPAIVVALGANQTAGKGLSREQAFPARLAPMLHAKGYDVRVLNEGKSGDTRTDMLAGQTKQLCQLQKSWSYNPAGMIGGRLRARSRR